MSQNSKKTLIILNNKNLNSYSEFNSFILPLKDFSVGFEQYFTVEEINEYAKKYNIYVIINKFMFIDDLNKIKIIKFENIKKIFIEDPSLISIFKKDNIIFFPIHMINNYEYVKYLESINITSCVISNNLTIKELKDIYIKTNSNLFYFYISKNEIMYSKRRLISNYNDYSNKKLNNTITMKEKVSNEELIFNEEKESTTCFYNKIFCASEYYEELKDKYNLIINLSFINNNEIDFIIKNYKNELLNDLIDSNHYFLDNKTKYKVGDIK